MLHRLTAKSKGNLYIQEIISIERDGIHFEFRPDENGQLVEIAVSMKVPQDQIQGCASEIGPGQGNSKATIVIGGNKKTRDQLINELQMIESLLGATSNGALEQVAWDSPHQEFIPENPSEQDLVAVCGFTHTNQYPDRPVLVTPESLKELIVLAPQFEHMKTIMAFYRDGMSYFNTFKYIDAFYRFYFVIEGLYANGKSSQPAVLKEFEKSREFLDIADKSLQSLIAEPRHSDNLEKLFHKEKCEISSLGLQKVLFNVRGQLHHFPNKGHKSRGTPFNQREFESITLLTMIIAASAIEAHLFPLKLTMTLVKGNVSERVIKK